MEKLRLSKGDEAGDWSPLPKPNGNQFRKKKAILLKQRQNEEDEFEPPSSRPGKEKIDDYPRACGVSLHRLCRPEGRGDHNFSPLRPPPSLLVNRESYCISTKVEQEADSESTSEVITKYGLFSLTTRGLAIVTKNGNNSSA
ncbi:hypothetical protein Syun_011799 [Stephania yunnanensis]|uniref:Uncharacterized protein n=1 Tax=Stephania yunnanensis TaxID=152371 RepID=A0AAP0JYZ6_9MAGN